MIIVEINKADKISLNLQFRDKQKMCTNPNNLLTDPRIQLAPFIRSSQYITLKGINFQVAMQPKGSFL